MKKDSTSPPALGVTRDGAEKRLDRAKARAMEAGGAEPEVQKVIHELQVHQIELEMQNEELRRRQLDLEETRRHYEDLFDFAPVGYCTLDSRGAILRVNLTGAALLGVPRAGLQRRRLAPFLEPSSRPAFAAFLSGVLAGEVGRTCEVEVSRSGLGPAILHLAGAVEASTGTGRISMTDVTERRSIEAALRRTEERYRLLADNSTDVIGVVGMDGVIRYVSPSCLALTGFTPEELTGRQVSDLLLPQDRPALEEAMARRGEGDEVQRARHRVCRKDGSLVWVERITRALRDATTGRILEIQLSVRDVSEMKETEGELIEQRSRQEQLVAERTASLLKANADLLKLIAQNHRTEDRLSRSEEKLKAAFDSMPEAVFISDLAGRFIEFNDAFVAFHRFRSRAECLTHLGDYPAILEVRTLDGEIAPLDAWAVPRALRGETVVDAEYTLRRKDTGETWVGRYNFAPIRDENGAIVGAVVVGSDVTDRKRAVDELIASRREAERKNEELRALFESASTSMALFDARPPFRVLTNNRRFQESYLEPLRSTGMVGKGLLVFAPEAATTGILGAFARVAETGKAESFQEFPYDGFPGGRCWSDWHVAPVFTDGKVVALAFVRVDVTTAVRARQRAETEVHRVKEAHRELEEFSYSVSHDLRTPLRAVHGFSSLLESRLGGTLDGESLRLLQTIKENGLLMGSLIDGLVGYTRIGHVDLFREEVDLAALARQVAGELLSEPRHGRVEVRIGELPPAFVDRQLVATALRHLLSNAIKFSEERTAPFVEVGFEAGPDGPVYFVRDNGVGFDPRYTDGLFRVFQRLGGPPEAGRTGIGLAVARRVVERHGGWIRAQGEVGGGATFRFSLVPGSPEAGPDSAVR